MLYLILALFSLGFSCLLSAYESAYFGLPGSQQLRLRQRARGLSERWLRTFYEQPRTFLGTLAIADTLAILLWVFSLAFLFRSFWPAGATAGFYLVLFLVALLAQLFVGEYQPRLFGAAFPAAVLRWGTLPLLPAYYVLYLPGRVLGRLAQYAHQAWDEQGEGMTARQLKEAILHTPETESPAEEKRILRALVDLDQTAVRSIMRARVDVRALPDTASPETVWQAARAYGHSRIPVYRASLDHIMGILYVKDLLKQPDKLQNWQQLIRQPFYVPDTKRLNTLLRAFQQQRQHMAIVVDEYGGTSGIITLEDILEEIFGDIRDEGDTHDPGYTRLADNAFVISGRMPLVDVCRLAGLPEAEFEPYRGGHGTLAGLVLALYGGLPPTGAYLHAGRFELQVLTATDTHVKRVKLVINDPAPQDEEDDA
ncbi:MAG: hemolysin family protein [Bacteroidetes bacterium]|jgi:putative hemolysin|nr:hemolysin family protein [Bacteroidota bacterium]